MQTSPTNTHKEYRSFGSFSLGGSSGSIKGKVICYGESALIGNQFEERFQSGCFGSITDCLVNIQHDRKRPVARQGNDLILNNSDSLLEATIDLTGTPLGEECRAMIDKNILRGLSAEFICEIDEWAGSKRIIKEAELCGIGIVDKPAYAGSTIQEIRECAPWYEARQGIETLLPLVISQVSIKNSNHELAIQRYLQRFRDLIERQIKSPSYRTQLVNTLNSLGGNRWLYL